MCLRGKKKRKGQNQTGVFSQQAVLRLYGSEKTEWKAGLKTGICGCRFFFLDTYFSIYSYPLPQSCAMIHMLPMCAHFQHATNGQSCVSSNYTSLAQGFEPCTRYRAIQHIRNEIYDYIYYYLNTNFWVDRSLPTYIYIKRENEKNACKGKELDLAAPESNALLWWTESSILCAFSTSVRERRVLYSLVQLDPFHTSLGWQRSDCH